MRDAIRISGLATILAAFCWLGVARGESRETAYLGWPIVRADGGGTHASSVSGNPDFPRRNVFMAVELSDTLAYCLQGAACDDSCASVMVLNISNPASPTFVSRLRFHGGADTAHNLKLLGDRLYVLVAAPGWSSMLHVIDVSDPLQLSVLGSYHLQGPVLGIDVADGLAYVADGVGDFGDTINAIRVLDVNDPSDIRQVASVPTDYMLTSIRARGDVAYAAGPLDVYTLNVSDPPATHVLSRLPSDYVPAEVELGESDSLIYVTEGDVIWPAYNTAFTIVNVADPEHPAIVGRYPLFGYTFDVEVSGHWAFVCNGTCGLRVFDVSDPTNPVSVGQFQSFSWGTADGYYAFAGRIALQDTILALADIGPRVISDMWGVGCYPSFNPDGPHPGDMVFLSVSDPVNPRLLGYYTPSDQDPVDVGEVVEDPLPTMFAVHQNYPNPFNPGTMIEFVLPKRSEVQLSVYNLLGQEVTRLVQSCPAGHHTIQLNMRDQASGVYLYELRAGDYSGTGKMLLLK